MTAPSNTPGALAARGLRRIADLAAVRPCGDRLRYMAGCRCAACRRANTDYENARAKARKGGDWNGLVPAAAARAHLAELSKHGIGRRTVQDAASVAGSVLVAIIDGSKTRIRARTERQILAVNTACAADHALIDAGPTWQLLDELTALGYSRAYLARQMGYANPSLQLNRRRVTVRNAYEVQRLHARLRHVPATPTLALLAELSEEGFNRHRVARQLAELAVAKHFDTPPDMTVRRGSIRQQTAELVRELHSRLMACELDEAAA